MATRYGSASPAALELLPRTRIVSDEASVETNLAGAVMRRPLFAQAFDACGLICTRLK